ncbi:MAG TPA: hypothetical protein PLP29_14320, partial [Candidatus Ozemobacteraceae bacterium]|nr:hypothetical protein [Candidatus Ozemobacteraceae bacterium]
AYGLFRFMVEFLRDDDRGGFFTPLHFSVSQLIGLGAVAAAAAWLALCAGRPQPELPDRDRTTNGAPPT